MSQGQNIVKSQFIQPHYIDVLGEEGLNAHEIAASLDAGVEGVLRKLRRDKWHSKDVQDWRAVSYVIANDVNGLEYETFALNTRAAKAFVSRWNSSMSDAYLNFLFDCEKAATIILPSVIKKLEETTAKLKAAEDASIRGTKRLVSAIRSGTILAPVYRENLFGDLELSWELKEKALMSEMQRVKAKARHARKTMLGLIARIEKLENEKDALELKERKSLFRLSKSETEH